MKSFTKTIVPVLAFIFLFGAAFSQKRKHQEKDEAIVTIKVNGREQDIEAYFEEWGEEFGRKMERMFEDPRIHIEIDEDDLDIDIDNFCIDIDEFAESIADAVTNAVTHMTIELHDLDPDDFDDDFDFDDDEDLEEVLEEIEEKYNSRVENIDKLKIKIREDYVKMEIDATLENGRRIEKMKIYPH